MKILLHSSADWILTTILESLEVVNVEGIVPLFQMRKQVQNMTRYLVLQLVRKRLLTLSPMLCTIQQFPPHTTSHLGTIKQNESSCGEDTQ